MLSIPMAKRKSPEYQSWCGMKTRCYNPRATQYKHYGGRGIIVCEEWKDSFERFLADMGYKPAPFYTLDRIDPDGNYCPKNCRWATPKEQSNNRREHALVSDGLNVAQAAEQLGVPLSRTYKRVAKGLPTSEILDPESRQHRTPKHARLLTLNGKTQSRTAWAREIGVAPHTITYRLSKGWSLELALTTPAK